MGNWKRRTKGRGKEKERQRPREVDNLTAIGFGQSTPVKRKHVQDSLWKLTQQWNNWTKKKNLFTAVSKSRVNLMLKKPSPKDQGQ